VDSAVGDSRGAVTPSAGAGSRSATGRGGAVTHAPAAERSHTAAVIDSDDGLLAVTVPFLEEGLRAGDLTLLSCRAETADLIRSALGVTATSIANDERIRMAGVRAPDALVVTFRYLDRLREAPSGRMRLVGEVDFGSTPRDWREGERYESAANAVLADMPLNAMCLYDRRVLPDEVVASAARTHPELIVDGRRSRSRRFRDPGEHLRLLPVPREPVEAGPPVLAIDNAPAPGYLRRRLGALLSECVPDPEQAGDLHLAVSEIAGNAFRHGARPVSVRVWIDSESIVCTVTDRGHGYDNPLAGFCPAHGNDLGRGGMGLWLARKLWDSVDLIMGAEGLTVRMCSRLR
jgi:anti-sigma regulatory factor (Ser/Thr protein kinase)